MTLLSLLERYSIANTVEDKWVIGLKGLDALAVALSGSSMHWLEIQMSCVKGRFHRLLSFNRKLVCLSGQSLSSCDQGFIRTAL